MEKKIHEKRYDTTMVTFLEKNGKENCMDDLCVYSLSIMVIFFHEF